MQTDEIGIDEIADESSISHRCAHWIVNECLILRKVCDTTTSRHIRHEGPVAKILMERVAISADVSVDVD